MTTDQIVGDVRVAVIGGGQAGLAVGYYLRRAGLPAEDGYVILDDADRPGGAWPHTWASLRLFSPAAYSSLPGWLMPAWDGDGGYPPARHVVEYLTAYEQRYQLPVRRPVRVHSVRAEDDDPRGRLLVHTSAGMWRAFVVVSATGTCGKPFVPHYDGADRFRGRQLHTTGYRVPGDFAGQRVLVVGGGNSGAQILADLHQHADTIWVTQTPPRFLPDDVDGRVLFDVATARRKALDAGATDTGGVAGLGDVVMVAPVRAARDHGALRAQPMFDHLDATGAVWADGRRELADAIIWCTGFRPALDHLRPLHLREAGGAIPTLGTRSLKDPRIHLVGYGDWTGPASATLIGVGRTARAAVDIITS